MGRDVLDIAVLGQELALLGDGHRGAHGVEEVAHEQREGNDEQHRVGQDLHDGKVAVGSAGKRGAEGREVERCDEALGRMGDAQRDSGDNGDDDADEQRARHVAGSQGNRHDDGDDADDKGGGGDVAQADERTGASGVMPASHRPIMAINRPRPTEMGVAQDHGDGVHDGLAQAAKDEQQDDDTLEEDNAHGHVPVAAAHGGGDARDHGVDAQTRRAGERAVGEDAHADGHDAGAQAGGAGERSRIDASAREPLPGLTAMM